MSDGTVSSVGLGVLRSAFQFAGCPPVIANQNLKSLRQFLIPVVDAPRTPPTVYSSSYCPSKIQLLKCTSCVNGLETYMAWPEFARADCRRSSGMLDDQGVWLWRILGPGASFTIYLGTHTSSRSRNCKVPSRATAVNKRTLRNHLRRFEAMDVGLVQQSERSSAVAFDIWIHTYLVR